MRYEYKERTAMMINSESLFTGDETVLKIYTGYLIRLRIGDVGSF